MCIRDRSIGEPGTQLTLRTFHAGGTAANIAANASIVAKNSARLEFEELRDVYKRQVLFRLKVRGLSLLPTSIM